MAQQELSLITKNRHVITPAEPTWTGIVPVPDISQIGVISHISTVYIYDKPSKELGYKSQNELIDVLKDSLSRVLVPFYPVAGRLRRAHGGRLELDCNAKGVEFIEVHCSEKLDDLDELFSLQKFEGLVPRVDYGTPIEELPLFLLQVTLFRCGSICIGTALSHVVADGPSACHLLMELAQAARGEPMQSSVDLDWRALQQHRDQSIRGALNHVDDFNHFSHLPTLLAETGNGQESQSNATIATRLTLTKKQVNSLKKAANREIGHDHERPFSRFEVISAHIWRCACKAREHKSEQMTALCFPVDLRSRLDPPLPPRYFGNAITDAAASCEAGELISRPLSYACQRIREEASKVTSKFISSKIEFLKAQKTLFKYQDRAIIGEASEGVSLANPNLGVSSWLNMALQGLDFGWGKEIYMGPATHDFDGDIVILPGSNSTDESVDVIVGLQVQHMEKFKDHFYNELMKIISHNS